MILILSIKGDHSTHRVCQILQFFKIPFLLIYPDEIVEIQEVIIDSKETNFSFRYNDKNYSYSDFKCMWYRRGEFNININVASNYQGLYDYYQYQSLYTYIIKLLNKLPSINKIGQGSVNKLFMLDIAKEVGLNIPDTIVTNDKNTLLNYFYFNNKELNVITKSIEEGRVTVGNDAYYTLTEQVCFKDIEEDFNYSLIQNKIDKKYEIRSFLLNNKFYSMAIISQVNEQTKIDFRNYDYTNQNRNVPIQLPFEIEEKLLKFSKITGINSGSFDLIKDFNGSFIFLEINPIGQFDMVAGPCNYDLHYLLALELKRIYNEENN